MLALNKADKFITYPYQGPVNQQEPNTHVLQMERPEPPSCYHSTCNNSIDFCVTLQEYLCPHCLSAKSPFIHADVLHISRQSILEHYKITSARKNTSDMLSLWGRWGELKRKNTFCCKTTKLSLSLSLFFFFSLSTSTSISVSGRLVDLSLCGN